MNFGMQNSDATDNLLSQFTGNTNSAAPVNSQNNRYMSVNASMDAVVPSSGKLQRHAPYVSPMYNAPGRSGLTIMSATAVTGDLEDENKPIEAAEEKAKIGSYSWFVMLMILAIRIVYQWQRSIFSYSYGYTGLGI